MQEQIKVGCIHRLLKQNLWIFSNPVIGNFIHLPLMKIQNTFPVNFPKKLLNFSNLKKCLI